MNNDLQNRFRGCLLGLAVGDTEGTAICGQIAGAYYGESGIPSEWLNKLTMRAKITEFADRLIS